MIALRLFRTASIWAIGSAVGCLLVSLAAPRLLGGHTYSVLTNSMAPAIETGDQVIALPRPATAIGAGQIVVFNDPEGSGRLFQHRVQRIRSSGRQIEVWTMGDANSGHERWRVSKAGTIEVVVARIPRAGYVIGPIGFPPVRAAISGIAWLALLLLLLFTIWRRPAERSIGAAAR